MPAHVGTAYVVVRALTNQLKGDIEKAANVAVKAVSKDIGKQVGDATADGFSEASGRIEEQASKVGDDAGKSLAQGVSNSIDRDFKPEALFQNKVGWFDIFRQKGDESGTGFLDGIRGSLDNMFPEAFKKAGDDSGKGFTTRFRESISDGFDKIPWDKMLKPGLLLMVGPAALTGALQLVSAGLAGAAGLANLFGQAAGGAGAAALGVFSAMGVAAGAMFLAFKTESPILDAFKEKVKALSGPWKDVGVAIQAAMLPAVGDAISRISKSALPALQDGLVSVGGALGGVATKFAELFENAGFLDALSQVAANAAPIVSNLGGAAKNLVDIIVRLAAAAGGVALRFAEWINKLTEGWAKTIALKQESGELAATFEKWGDVAARLGGVLKDFGMAVWNILKQAEPLAMIILGWMEKGAATMREWTESASGENALKTFFENAVPVLEAVGRLLKDIGLLFGEGLTSDPTTLVAFIDTLREDLLPVLADMFKALSSNGPALVDLFTAVAGVITDLANSGVLGATTTAFQILAEVLSLLLQIPFVGTLLGWAAMGGVFVGVGAKMWGAAQTVKQGFDTIKGAAETAKLSAGVVSQAYGTEFGRAGTKVKEFASKVGTHMADAGRSVGTGLKTAGTSLLDFGKKLGGSILTGIKTLGSTLALVGRTIMFSVVPPLWAMTTALLANPITWIVLGIMALIAVFVLLWVKCEAFRNFWIGLWEIIKNAAGVFFGWIKIAWDVVVAAFQVALNFLVTIFQTVFGVIQAVVEVVWNVIKTAFEIVFNIIKTYVEIWLTIFQYVFAVIQALVMAAWYFIQQGFEIVWNFIKAALEVLQTIFGAIFDAIMKVVDVVWEAIKAGWNVLWNIIKAALDVLKAIFTTIFNAIKAVVEAVWNAIKWAWDILWNAIKAALDVWKAIFETIFNAIKTVVLAVWDGIKAAWDVIWNAIKAAVDALRPIFETVFNAIKTVVTAVWNGIKSAWDVIYNAISGAINALKGVFTSVFGAIGSFISGVWDGIKSGFDAVIGGIKSAINIIISGINVFIGGINSMANAISKVPGVPDIPQISKIPKLAKGGIVSPATGGTLALLAEAGRKERVEPLGPDGMSRRDRALMEALQQAVDVRVFIGDQELTHIVRTEVRSEDRRTAASVSGGRRI